MSHNPLLSSAKRYSFNASPNTNGFAEPEPVLPSPNLEDKEKQINRLAKSLKQKIDEVIEVEGTNRLLREKLKAFQEQNSRNVEIAQEEIVKLSQELDRSNTTKKLLEEDIDKLREDFEELHKKFKSLERTQLDLCQENDYLKRFEAELLFLKEFEAKYEVSQEYYEEKLQKKVFNLLKDSVLVSRRLTSIGKKIRKNEIKNTLTRCFKALQKNVIIERILNHKKKHIDMSRVGVTFFAWKEFTSGEKIVKNLMKKREEKTLEQMMTAWKTFVHSRKKERKVTKAVDELYKTRLLSVGFQAFRQNHKIYHLNEKKGFRLMEVAKKQNAGWIKKSCLTAWKTVVKQIFKPKRMKNEAAAQFYMRRLEAKTVSSLITNVLDYQEKYRRASKLNDKVNLGLMALTFEPWKKNLKPLNKKKEALNGMCKDYVTKKYFGAWRNIFESVIGNKFLDKKINEYRTSYLVSKYFKAMLHHSVQAKRRKIIVEQLKNKVQDITLQRAFSNWSQAYQNRLEEKKNQRTEDYEILKKYFSQMKIFRKMKKVKHAKENRAFYQFSKSMNKFIGNAFLSWKNISKRKLRNNQAVQKHLKQKRLEVLKEGFENFKLNLFRNVRLKLGNMSEVFKKIEAESEKNFKYSHDLDSQRSSLMSSMKLLNGELEDLKDEAFRKDREIVIFFIIYEFVERIPREMEKSTRLRSHPEKRARQENARNLQTSVQLQRN